MKKTAFCLMLVLGTGLLAWGTVQGGADAMEQNRRMKQELEIMQGILRSSLNFAADEYVRREEAKPAKRASRNPWRNPNISAFYLKGQGAVFTIPVSGSLYIGVAYSGAGASASQYAESARQAAETARQRLAQSREALEFQAQKLVQQAAELELKRKLEKEAPKAESTTRPSQPPTPPSPPAPPPVPPEPSREEINRRLAEAQEKIEHIRIELEADRPDLKEVLTLAKQYVVEALARHGDSLTFLGADEHINIVFKFDEGAGFRREPEEAGAQQEVITIRKSIISEFKAGRLTLDGLKQKILIYRN